MNENQEQVAADVDVYNDMAADIIEDLSNAGSCETGSDLIANLQSALENTEALAKALKEAIAEASL
jgi:hypothetical protein